MPINVWILLLYELSAIQFLKRLSILLREFGFPIFTVGTTELGLCNFKNFTNLLSSEKLECSLYGISNLDVLSLKVLIFIFCSELSDVEPFWWVHPVGIMLNMWLYCDEKSSKYSTGNLKFLTFSISIKCIWALLGEFVNLSNNWLSSKARKIFILSGFAQILQLNSSAIARKTLSLPE